MKADPRGVLTGTHFIDGDHACCEGALAAGARFAAGYPITPSTEVVERFAQRVPTVGGCFIQMEDELAASITLQGGVWGGAKAFTVTSGARSRLGAVDGEIRAIHAAQVATAALLRMHDMGRMVALGIEGGRKRQNFGWTKLRTEAAGFTALHHNRNTSFCHEFPPLPECWTLPNPATIMRNGSRSRV